MFQKKKQSCNFKILQVVDLIFPYGLNGFSFINENYSNVSFGISMCRQNTALGR